jgi:hypothetical protein
MTQANPPADAHRFSRRSMLRLAGLGLGSVLFTGHTPYGQWTVYRRRNLFIVASRTDPDAVALAYALAGGLAVQLPTSHARMTRATDPVRVASLLATGQLDVAVVARADAAGMLAGTGDFRAVGAVPLRRLADLGAHLLVALESFRNKHAYLLADAVEHLRPTLPIPAGAAADMPAVPEHVGALAYRTGLPLPIERGAAEAADAMGVLPGPYQP